MRIWDYGIYIEKIFSKQLPLPLTLTPTPMHPHSCIQLFLKLVVEIVHGILQSPLRGKRSSLLWRDGGPTNSSNPLSNPFSNPLSNPLSNPFSNQNVQVGNRIFLKPNTKNISTKFHKNLSPSPPEGERFY